MGAAGTLSNVSTLPQRQNALSWAWANEREFCNPQPLLWLDVAT